MQDFVEQCLGNMSGSIAGLSKSFVPKGMRRHTEQKCMQHCLWKCSPSIVAECFRFGWANGQMMAEYVLWEEQMEQKRLQSLLEFL